ncbi:Hypothetical predicted protein [Olea europaea subsp. europaea]|uniref:Bulb-type lectin domain-containing protein n=1 Tax=Olea europaea subsp. europaea TaxID=158383 RepID=A0A8S0SN33_OLEEU|nr:Hypothetical predicted protein [Olea europaea subsp. europaea]
MKSIEVACFLLLLSSLPSILKFCTAIDIISTTQILRDGDTLVSSGGRFELGFFSPDNTNNRYVGIWYTNVTIFKAVWVANREIPVTSTSGILKVLEPDSHPDYLNGLQKVGFLGTRILDSEVDEQQKHSDLQIQLSLDTGIAHPGITSQNMHYASPTLGVGNAMLRASSSGWQSCYFPHSTSAQPQFQV